MHGHEHSLSEEQRLLAETLQRFLQAENEFEFRRQRLSGSNPDLLALCGGRAELGVIGAAFDEAERRA